jgi:dienelactone hydrolase
VSGPHPLRRSVYHEIRGNVVYPGATHAFVVPRDKPVDVLGHHIAYDEKLAKEAQERAEAFIASHLK